MSEEQAEYERPFESLAREKWEDKRDDCDARRGVLFDPLRTLCSISRDICRFDRCHERKWGKNG